MFVQLLFDVLCMGMVDRTDSRHSMLELGSELSRELLPLSLLWPAYLPVVSREPAQLSELLPLPDLWGPAPSLSSLRSISLTLFLLGTGGFTPAVLITPLLGFGDFKIPLGPLVSSVMLLLLLVCFNFGLSEP